jgi:HAD superfamily phosphatase (TIGR01668 family)
MGKGLVPDYQVGAIREIDFGGLRQRGVRYLVMDVDHTLVPLHGLDIDAVTVKILNELRERGVVDGLYLASNSSRDLSAIAGAIGAQVITPRGFIRKPRRAYFRRVLQTIGCRSEEAVMVGDKLLFDVWGGNRAGLVTVLVSPIGPDQWFDRIIRRRFWEQRVLRHGRLP